MVGIDNLCFDEDHWHTIPNCVLNEFDAVAMHVTFTRSVPRARLVPTIMPSTCAELSEDLWEVVIEHMCQMHGLRAAKMLRKTARVSRIFAQHAREHPDNNILLAIE